GLQAKFILVIAGLLVAIFSGMAVVLVRSDTATLRKNLREQSQAFALLATKPIGDSFVTYQNSGRIRIAQEIQGFTDLNSNIANVEVIDLNGQVLFSQHQNLSVSVDSTAASSFAPVFESSHGNLTA